LPHTIGIDVRKIEDFGIGTYIRQLVTSLTHLDSDNHYVLFAGPGGRDHLPELPDTWSVIIERSKVYSARELFSLSWRLLRTPLDLYHATHYVLPLVVPCRTVVTIHDIIHLLFPEFLPNPLALHYAHYMIRRSLTRGDRIIAASRNTRSDLMDYFDLDGRKIRKIRVIYQGVGDEFRHAPDPEAQRSRLEAYGLDGPYLLFVGNPKPHKNLDNVVKAYARALSLGGFDAPLVCVGDREGGSFKVRQRAEQLGIGDRVRWLGHVPQEDLPILYRGAALFLYPTLYEGFGLPVVEAMASGVPVVTSNTSSLKEIAEGYAHVVDPMDVEQIAAAIHRCMNDEAHRLELAEKGRRRAAEFSWDLTARRTLEVYTSALRGAPAPPATGPSDRRADGPGRRAPG